MTIDKLKAGERFKTNFGKSGVIIDTGINTTVRYDGQTVKEINGKQFVVANHTAIISSKTEVERI